jgi:signal transduction histidine kinase
MAKTEFLAHMSHELRTPLNAIIGFAEALAEGVQGPLNTKQQEYAEDVAMAGRHLLGLVNDLLDLSVIDSGKLPLSEEKVDLGRLIDKVGRLTHSLAHKNGLSLITEVSPHLPPVFVDARKIEQVLLNLIGNAIKFTPDGGRITVRAAVDTETQGLVVSVVDTGKGIAEGDIPLVLSPFGRVQSASRQTQEGVGLGLPLSQRLVELHQGGLTIISHPGQGTVVNVYLPVTRVMKG